MTDEIGQLEALRTVSPQCSINDEGPVRCVLMPNTSIATAGGPERMTVVLCPLGQGGYMTRLFLEKRVHTNTALNWMQLSLLGRNWETWSWNNIPASLPWITIFAEHVRCLR